MATTSGNIFLDAYDVPTTLPESPAYEVPSSLVKIKIENASATNYSVAPVDLTVYVVADGKSAEGITKTVVSKKLAAGDTILLYEIIGRPILSGGSIQAEATVASSISLSVGGAETSA